MLKVCLFFPKSQPRYAYKCYGYKKTMHIRSYINNLGSITAYKVSVIFVLTHFDVSRGGWMGFKRNVTMTFLVAK